MAPDKAPLDHQSAQGAQPKTPEAEVPAWTVAPAKRQKPTAADVPQAHRTGAPAVRHTASWDLFNPSTEDFVLLDTPCF
ncbi:expressed unknown protein [Ectocarpus siliculosus]|uniref:Uncharacterized protein n=1 Tax=Ectocarpus siliculosus TaxID=2880 RepID=D7FHS5_ECTSI|nr:expressed unknown protein [Ectocarpus siliculosus]|eukprot:CBJ28630.1 expressed unknown protein [Ectocarpus siliculosus]